jgi:hypothetical protein
VEDELSEAGVVGRSRVQSALHFFEPGTLGVEAPRRVGFGPERLPEPRGQEVGYGPAGDMLEHEPDQQGVVVVVLPREPGGCSILVRFRPTSRRSTP